MKLIKEIEYQREYENQLFFVKLEYGMRDDQTNHMLKMTIWHVLDKKTGKKTIVAQDDLIDVTSYPNIYEPKKYNKNDIQNIKYHVNERIATIVQSKNVQDYFVSKLEEMEG